MAAVKSSKANAEPTPSSTPNNPAPPDYDEVVILEDEHVKKVRDMLHLGLAAFGELERLQDAQETIKLLGESLPDELRVIRVTADAEAISDFADALRLIEHKQKLARGARGPL